MQGPDDMEDTSIREIGRLAKPGRLGLIHKAALAVTERTALATGVAADAF